MPFHTDSQSQPFYLLNLSRDDSERFLAGGCEEADCPGQRPQQNQRALPGAAAHSRGLPHLLRHASHGDPLAHHYRLVRRQHRLQGIYRIQDNIIILITTSFMSDTNQSSIYFEIQEFKFILRKRCKC